MPGPQDQHIMQLLNRYYPGRTGRSQLEILAMGGVQDTPLRRTANLPNRMNLIDRPFTPENVASGAAPLPGTPGSGTPTTNPTNPTNPKIPDPTYPGAPDLSKVIDLTGDPSTWNEATKEFVRSRGYKV